ncbi:MAG TPA: LamG domain-containing protein, partial [Polyangiaceae bacterium]
AQECDTLRTLVLRRRLGFGGASALSVTLGIALGIACSVYDESLLTGGASGQGGSLQGGEGGEGNGATGGTAGDSGGTQGGGTSGKGGAAGDGGSSTGGSSTGGSPTGGSAGDTGGTGNGGSATGGEGGEPGTGGDAGSGTGGKAGSASGGSAGNGMTGGSGGVGGSAGTGGSSGGMCGKCGCGMPETDTDMDGVPDCIDMCVGYVDADCSALRSGLVHRYSFSGTGTTVTDSKGTAHGTAVNATLSGTGTLSLAGGNGSSPPHVNLPNALLSTLTNATLETWVTWNQSGTTGRDWQRIFDFGTSGTEGMQTSTPPADMSYVFLTARAGTSPNALRAAFTTTGTNNEIQVNAASALPTGTRQHVAVVLDAANDEFSIFLNGVRQTSVLFTGSLAGISDVNNWLGRSQYSNDYEFIGVFDEFRIYGIALTTAQVRTSSMGGPDAAFLQ